MLEQLSALHPDDRTRAFWEYCKRRELRFQQCGGCGEFRFPPMQGCRSCGSTEHEWVAVSGRGRVFSYTNVVHPATPQIVEEVPYNVVVVEFDDAPGARLVSNVVGVGPGEVHVDMELDLCWEEPEAGVLLPRFRRVSSDS